MSSHCLKLILLQTELVSDYPVPSPAPSLVTWLPRLPLEGPCHLTIHTWNLVSSCFELFRFLAHPELAARFYWFSFLSHILSNSCPQSGHSPGPQPVFAVQSHHSRFFLAHLELGFSKCYNLVLGVPRGLSSLLFRKPPVPKDQGRGRGCNLQSIKNHEGSRGEKWKPRVGGHCWLWFLFPARSGPLDLV